MKGVHFVSGSTETCNCAFAPRVTVVSVSRILLKFGLPSTSPSNYWALAADGHRGCGVVALATRSERDRTIMTINTGERSKNEVARGLKIEIGKAVGERVLTARAGEIAFQHTFNGCPASVVLFLSSVVRAERVSIRFRWPGDVRRSKKTFGERA